MCHGFFLSSRRSKTGISGLLKNAHLLCYAANRSTQRIPIRVTFRLYASRFGFLRALHLSIFEPSMIMGL